MFKTLKHGEYIGIAEKQKRVKVKLSSMLKSDANRSEETRIRQVMHVFRSSRHVKAQHLKLLHMIMIC